MSWTTHGTGEPRYDQITYGHANPPLRDSLPTFLRSRGEIIYGDGGGIVRNAVGDPVEYVEEFVARCRGGVSPDAHRVAAIADEELAAWDAFIADIQARNRNVGR